MKRFSSSLLCVLLVLAALSQCVRAPSSPRVIVTEAPGVPAAEPAGEYLAIDTQMKTLRIRRDGVTVAEFDRIAAGSGGVGIKRKRGDKITPTGTFTIGWINRSSKFKLFIGLNYPSLEYAERGLREGIIREAQFEKIRSALERGKKPPQNTGLGGLIGIHGIGRGSLAIHQAVNWTDGCIALDNKQIEELARLVRIGQTVVIR